MIRLALFDIDGTLIRTGGAGVQAFAKVCELEFNVPDGTRELPFAGRTDPSIIREFFGRHGIKPTRKNFQRFYDAYVFWLDHLLAQSEGRVLPGVREMIGELCALPEPPAVGLLTGNIRLGAEIKLTFYELWEHFQTGAFGDDHEDRNQLAAIAQARGSRLLGEPLRGEEILVIGDTPHDIACGRAIGAKVLAVATGIFRLEQLRGQAPTWAVEDLRQVVVKEVCA